MVGIRCPVCRKPLPEGKATPTFPFCSERCKMVDLGRWLDGSYAISEPLPQTPPDKESPADTDSS
jgi:hypothetical protein